MAESNGDAPPDLPQLLSHELDDRSKSVLALLKGSCSPYGDEIKSQMSQTSMAISCYGHVYLVRGQITIGLEQKINFIKSAVLLHAAKSRYELYNTNEDQLKQTSDTIDHLHKVIFGKMGMHHSDSKILRETSEGVKKRFQQLRELQETEISKIPSIKSDALKKQLLRMQKEKIKFIRGLSEKNTKDYTVLMYYVAGKCKKILGDEPCEFAIAGLGSLARKEATLHSAFKYIIILDDKIDDLEIGAIEYFRWFALLFNVILIGLGETSINSFRIEGMNDISHEGGDWYRDVYTPSGVGVDGMIPLIHKDCPEFLELGVIELILPASKFYPYLYSLGDDKDELMLKNLLRQHCLVYGSEDVYDQYTKLVCNMIESVKCSAYEISYLASANTKQLMEATPFITDGYPQFKKDSIFYRPISDCLGYIGSFFKWNCFSGFEIIASLKNFSGDLGALSGQSQKCHLFDFALAVACELRVKAYAVENGCRLRVVSRYILDIIETDSMTICMQQMWILTRYLDSIRLYAEKGRKPDLKICKLFTTGEEKWENLLKEQLDNLEKNKSMSKNDKNIILLNCIHFAINQRDKWELGEAANSPVLEKVKRYFLRHPGYIENIIATTLLVCIYADQDKPNDVLKICEDYVKSWPDKTPPFNALKVRRYQVNALMRTHSVSEVLNYCDNALRQSNDVAAMMAFGEARVLALMERNPDNVESHTTDLNELIRLAAILGCRSNDARTILCYMEDIFHIQYSHNWIEDAAQTASLAYVIGDSKVQFVSIQEIPKFLGYPGASCFLQLAAQSTDGDRIRKMTNKVFNIFYTIDFAEDIQCLFVSALQLLIKEQLKNPSVLNIEIIKSCVSVIPSRMTDLPLMEEARKYLEVFETTRDALLQILQSPAMGQTSQNLPDIQDKTKTAAKETSQDSNETPDKSTATEKSTNDPKGATAAVYSGGFVDVTDMPRTPSGKFRLNFAVSTDRPRKSESFVEVTEQPAAAAGSSSEKSDKVHGIKGVGNSEHQGASTEETDELKQKSSK